MDRGNEILPAKKRGGNEILRKLLFKMDFY
jgi:hypothetical protein